MGNFKKIPVVILSTSEEQGDVLASYEYGANSYIVKPVNFENLSCIIGNLIDYWFGTVCLPQGKNHGLSGFQ